MHVSNATFVASLEFMPVPGPWSSSFLASHLAFWYFHVAQIKFCIHLGSPVTPFWYLFSKYLCWYLAIPRDAVSSEMDLFPSYYFILFHEEFRVRGKIYDDWVQLFQDVLRNALIRCCPIDENVENGVNVVSCYKLSYCSMYPA
jgi:hypothetical protein